MSQAGPHYCLTVFTARTQSVHLPQNCLNPQSHTDILLWGPVALTQGCQPLCVRPPHSQWGEPCRSVAGTFWGTADYVHCCRRVLTDGPGAASFQALWGCAGRAPLPDCAASAHRSLLPCPSCARALIEVRGPVGPS